MNRVTLPMTLLLASLALHCDKPAPDKPAPAATTAPAPTPTPTPKPAAAAPSSPTPATAGSAAKIASDKINPAGKSVADRVAKAYADAMKTGSFADSADLSDELKKVTPAQWQAVLNQTKAKYGAEKSMDFADAWNDEKGGTMYRYKASFAKADKVEFRVDLNGQNVATKFGSYDWVDSTP